MKTKEGGIIYTFVHVHYQSKCFSPRSALQTLNAMNVSQANWRGCGVAAIFKDSFQCKQIG